MEVVRLARTGSAALTRPALGLLSPLRLGVAVALHEGLARGLLAAAGPWELCLWAHAPLLLVDLRPDASMVLEGLFPEPDRGLELLEL